MLLLVWIIMFSIFLWIVLVIPYWEHLLRTKDTYTKDELISFIEIFNHQLQKMNPEHSITGYISFVIGILVAWLLTLIGGLISPDSGQDFDFASSEMANYFFQSGLFVFILHIVWPSMKFYFEENFAPDIILKFLDNDKPFFTALATTLPSISVACWGVYHELSFLFILINGVILLTYASYQIQREKEMHHKQTDENNEKYTDNNTDENSELEL